MFHAAPGSLVTVVRRRRTMGDAVEGDTYPLESKASTA
jgi:hypothetical protein